MFKWVNKVDVIRNYLNVNLLKTVHKIQKKKYWWNFLVVLDLNLVIMVFIKDQEMLILMRKVVGIRS